MRGLTLMASVAIVLMVMASVGATTFAYFSDTETVSGNTFTTGTLDMQLSNDGSVWDDGVTATWTSPQHWLPGDEFTWTLHIKNIGSVGSENIFIKPVDIDEGDGLTPESEPTGSPNDLANYIFITDFTTTVTGPPDWTVNQIGWMSTSPYSPWSTEPPLTLAEFAATPYKFWIFGSPAYDPYILAAGGVNELQLTIAFKFDPDADNNYQGDTCSFSLKILTFNGPVEGGVIIWESSSGYGYGN